MNMNRQGVGNGDPTARAVLPGASMPFSEMGSGGGDCFARPKRPS